MANKFKKHFKELFDIGRQNAGHITCSESGCDVYKLFDSFKFSVIRVNYSFYSQYNRLSICIDYCWWHSTVRACYKGNLNDEGEFDVYDEWICFSTSSNGEHVRIKKGNLKFDNNLEWLQWSFDEMYLMDGGLDSLKESLVLGVAIDGWETSNGVAFSKDVWYEPNNNNF